MNGAKTASPAQTIPAPRGRVRLRTLVLIRWIAAAGQLVTLLVVNFGLGFQVPLALALPVVAASALVNLWAASGRRAGVRLTDRQAALYLGFDILQLSLLLFLTGGLLNPFALLILAPVTIAATILSRRSTLALGLLAVACITGLGLWHLPLPWAGPALAIPPLYTLGLWLALVMAAVLLAAYNWSVSEEARRMSEALSATQTALAREQRLSALGMLAAAAAHELGSPLATIAVVAKEIARDVPRDSPLVEDVDLLLSQSERCREILTGLTHWPEETAESAYNRVPLPALVETAAAPHRRDDVEVALERGPAPGAGDAPAPVIAPSPEIHHGLGSLIQNAVQFARARVVVDTRWDRDHVSVEIRDDGPGFPPGILGMLGEPYVSSRKGRGEHMGLGVFVAQTLLERTGAVLSFGNRRRGGAVVMVRWPREALEPREEAAAKEEMETTP